MKRYLFLIIAVFIVFIPSNAKSEALKWSDFDSDLDIYITELGKLQNETNQETNDSIVIYFKSSMDLALKLKKMLSSSVEYPYSYYDNVILPHIEELNDLRFELPVTQVVRREGALYENHVQPYLAKFILLPEVQLRTALFKRKYFHGDSDSQGNLIEGFLNSYIPLFQFNEKSDAWYRCRGVSQFEMTFRAEPFVSVWDSKDRFDWDPGQDFGALAALGLVYHSFPEIDDKTLALEEKWLPRMGLKAAVGATFSEDPALLFGGGIQLRSLTAWALYNTKFSGLTLAIGINDFSFMKKFVPVF